MSDEVKVDRAGTTVIVTLARERRMNAVGKQMRAELQEVYTSLRSDSDARVLVITGEGARAFCVGQDVKETVDRGSVRPREERDLLLYSPIFNDVWLPCIVAVNGVCVGGAFHFLADADIILASKEHASFVDTHTSVGQASVLEAISLLGRVGTGSLTKMMVLGSHGPIDAEEAHRINLVDEVVPHERLLDRALELAELIGRNSPAAIEVSKRALLAAIRGPFAPTFESGWQRLREHWNHPDVLEGARAFAEKRPPNWHVGRRGS